MGQIIRAISDLAGKVISLSLVGGAILLVAGEIRLAALKKASQGSSKLSHFPRNQNIPPIVPLNHCRQLFQKSRFK